MSAVRIKDGVPVAADFAGHEPPLVLDFSTGSLYAIDETGTVVEVGGSAGVSELDDLDDVDTTTTAPAIGDALVWNGSLWVPQVAFDFDTYVLSTTPIGFWKLNGGTGTTTSTDETGNGHTLTYSGASYLPAGPKIMPAYPSDHGVFLEAQGFIAAAGPIITAPWTGSWSFMTVMQIYEVTSWAVRFFQTSAAGEDETQNHQANIVLAQTTGFLSSFLEYSSSATDETQTANMARTPMTVGRPYIVHVTKDSSTKIVRLYINGKFVDSVTHTNAPSGGSAALFRLTDGANQYCEMTRSRTALWDGTVLTEAQIFRMALLAGLSN